MHPYWSHASQRAYDQAHGIFTQAWSPLGRASSVLQEPVINAIADKHHKSAAQVILRWEFQLGVGIIPKANSPNHLLANLDIFYFELTPEELSAITELVKPNVRLKIQIPSVYLSFLIYQNNTLVRTLTHARTRLLFFITNSSSP